MTRVISIDRLSPLLLPLLILTTLALLVAPFEPAWSANIAEEEKAIDEKPREVEGGSRSERIVVAPEPPHWGGWDDWDDWHPGYHRSAPKVKLWVDRGDWSSYHTGDRLWVYFRVDRPCYVTIMDHMPDGRVDMLYPNRWSGSNFVRPGCTYRVPESRGYSLRIAGPGGVETLVACAHEAPWPSGPCGYWIPDHRPHRGRVVVGRPGRSPLPGRRGRVIFPPWWFPIPPGWRDRPERWTCDSVSFYVVEQGPWYGGGPWHGGGPWYHDGSWDEWDAWPERDMYDEGRHEGEWDDDYRGGRGIHRRFRMRGCSDRMSQDVRVDGQTAVFRIECVESSRGDPTEIVGRVIVDGQPGDGTIFRIDVEGRHGEKPSPGRVFAESLSPFRVEMEIVDFEVADAKPGRDPRIEWIEFDVRAFDERGR